MRDEWGEWLALFLAAIWITPQVWSHVSRRLGLIEVSEDCGCEARKQWLNTLGGRLASSPRWKWLAAWIVRRSERN